MKTLAQLSLVTAACGLVFAATAPTAHASWFGKVYEDVVAEQTNPTAAPSPPTAQHPAYYVAYDGGYIEAGDPIGGERPPPASAVAGALQETLASQHYLPASAAHPPSLVITYHWGLLNRDSFQIRNIFKIQPNLRARIYLVAPRHYAQRMVQDIMDRRQPGLVHIPILDPKEITLLQLAADDRYFVIVSAYDYHSVVRGKADLVWRTRMSVRSAGTSMAEAMPALLRGGAPYFGRNFADAQTVVAPVGQAAAGTARAGGFLPPPEVTQQMNQAYLESLLQKEHHEFSGALPGESYPTTATPADASLNSSLPPALAARIRAYENEKDALQQALEARIRTLNPGPDTRRAIDAFDRENATRISNLSAERRSIRSELAKLAAANTNPAQGKSLQALQQEFAEGVHQLEAENAAAK